MIVLRFIRLNFWKLFVLFSLAAWSAAVLAGIITHAGINWVYSLLSFPLFFYIGMKSGREGNRWIIPCRRPWIPGK